MFEPIGAVTHHMQYRPEHFLGELAGVGQFENMRCDVIPFWRPACEVHMRRLLHAFDRRIQPLLGLTLNLPTGNAYLPGNQRFTRMDPDLVYAGSYGVGFNVNPTAGFLFALNQTTVVSLAAGCIVVAMFNTP